MDQEKVATVHFTFNVVIISFSISLPLFIFLAGGCYFKSWDPTFNSGCFGLATFSAGVIFTSAIALACVVHINTLVNEIVPQ